LHIAANEPSYEAAQSEAFQFLENVDLVNSVWGGDFEGILSQSIEASAFLKLSEYKVTIEKVLERLSDREQKRQLMEYYRDKMHDLTQKQAEVNIYS
jgi:hypothetical protein